MNRQNESIRRARVVAIANEGRRAQVVKNAAATKEGRELLDLIAAEYGNPQIVDNSLQSFSNLGAFGVVQWLLRMEFFTKDEDDD